MSATLREHRAIARELCIAADDDLGRHGARGAGGARSVPGDPLACALGLAGLFFGELLRFLAVSFVAVLLFLALAAVPLLTAARVRNLWVERADLDRPVSAVSG